MQKQGVNEGTPPHMKPETKSIAIVVNGEPAAAPEMSTVADLVARIGLDPERVAVELDRRIVRRAEWASTALVPGAKVEIVQFVGGG